MESHAQLPETSVRAAASAVMLRDGPGGLEVFLLKRHGLSAVLAGAHVFPGGKVDAEDASLDAGTHLDMGAPALWAALHEPQLDEAAAVALYVAALREAFEETGVLYARDAALPARGACQARHEGSTFGQMLARHSLRLEVSRLQPWSRWITPIVAGTMRKRFDTRFFLAALPPGQIARHDDHEAVDSVWLTPRAALRQYWDRQIELAPPQIMGLAHLARHPCVASAMAQARRRPPPLVLPEPFELEGARMVCYPGDERHPVRERALPGPTRLIYRHGRFEPVDGLAALLAEAS